MGVLEHVFGAPLPHTPTTFQPDDLPGTEDERGLTMVGAINRTFQAGLEAFPSLLMFGEDIEDPKGGVFGLTAGLSRRFPGRVVNSPLAEGTIVGLGVGLAAAGFRPVFELQFIDFLGPGLNQLMNQMTTLRWRSKGEWTCPLVLYAPYGAYLPAGGIWHSQSNDGWWAHTPGLRVAIPSTPQDAVGLFWAAFQDDDPSLVLIPKHLCRVRMPAQRFDVIPFGRAAVRREGDDVTVVSWGNGRELAEMAAQRMEAEGVSVEVIDLRTLVPCDWAAIERSLQKTGRLVVVHEDNRTCGFGQAVISEMNTRPGCFDLLLSPPQLVARPDVHVPFCPDLERALLPDVDRVVSAIRATME
jgi:2-oxoisovalerate dehydrogenase E1 component